MEGTSWVMFSRDWMVAAGASGCPDEKRELFPLLLSSSPLQVAIQPSGFINEVICRFNSVCEFKLASMAHACTQSPVVPSAATQAVSLYPSAAFTLTFSSGKRLWFLAAICSLLIVASLCPSPSLHNSLMHKTEHPMRKHAPVWAHLIWIKDVFWFRLFHKARENLHYPELGGRSMCVFFTRLSLGLFCITSLQSRSGC